MSRAVAAFLMLLAAGCAPVPPIAAPVPSAICDERMVDHNRRACPEKGLTFEEPSPAAPCGRCQGRTR